jgi:small subunit ribosomal protein S5
VLTKSIGSANSHNVVRATFTGLKMLRDPAAVRRLRGKEEDEQPVAAVVPASA